MVRSKLCSSVRACKCERQGIFQRMKEMGEEEQNKKRGSDNAKKRSRLELGVCIGR